MLVFSALLYYPIHKCAGQRNNMNCVFCEINKEKTRIIEEKEYTLVILSNPRLTEGHLLIIPKRHVEKISELNKEEKKNYLIP